MKYAVVFASIFVSTYAFAGGSSSCHFHGGKMASEAVVIDCATQRKDMLSQKGKVDAAWKAVKHEKVEQITSKSGKKEWKVTFVDPGAKDASKSKLFVYLSGEGNFLAANHTGE
jgi:hypothetical protein